MINKIIKLKCNGVLLCKIGFLVSTHVTCCTCISLLQTLVTLIIEFNLLIVDLHCKSDEHVIISTWIFYASIGNVPSYLVRMKC